MSLQTWRSNTRLVGALPYAIASVIFGASLALALGKLQNPRLAIVLIVTCIGSLLILMRPKLGLPILAVITYTNLSDILISFYQLPSIAQPFIALLIASVTLNWLYTKKRPVGWSRVLVWLLLNEILIFLSLLYADNLVRAEAGLEDFTKDALVALLVAILVQDMKTLRATIWAMLLVAIFLGSITAYQTVTGTYDNNYWGFGRVGKATVDSISTNRSAGPYENANFYARTLLLFIPLALDRLLHEKKSLLRALAAWALLVSVLGVLWSFSRGAFLASVVMFAYMFIRRPPAPIVLAVVIGVIACIYPFVPANYTERIATIVTFNPFGGQDLRNDGSFRGRLSENLVGWLMFRDHPIFGVGKGNYKARYLDYSSRLGIDPRLEDRSAHNLYLEIASEQGLVGLVLFFAMLTAMFKMMRRSQAIFSDADREGDANMVRSLEYGLIGYLVASIFLHMAFPRTFWFMVGLTMSTLHIAQNEMTLQIKKHLSNWRTSSGLAEESVL